MERRQQEAAIEAVLFAMGESVEIDKLAEVIEEEEETARQIIAEMKDKWEKEGRGVSIVEFENAYQMCTRGDMYEYLLKVAKTPKKYVLTETLLETLSIIAYKQPVTKLDIERIRGVNCDHAVNRLIDGAWQDGRAGKAASVRNDGTVPEKLRGEIPGGSA